MTFSPPAGTKRKNSGTAPAGLDPRADADLALAAAGGDSAAFEALYRRHAAAAWGVASAVASRHEDAADAVSEAFTKVLKALASGRVIDGTFFRGYLLAATRNAAIDFHRRADRVRSSDRLEDLDVPMGGRSTGDRLDDSHDADVVASAFRGLPERWRTVLWLTEVEGVPAREAAGLLGLTANSVAQLAVRARAGLRERFVQAHLRLPVPAGCRFSVDHLGGYVTGGLRPRELSKVEQHLAGCAACRERASELQDLGQSLRRAVLPLPLLVGPAALTKWKLTSAAMGPASTGGPAGPLVAAAGSTPAGAGPTWTSRWLPRTQRPLAVASTGIFALAVISSSVLGTPQDFPGNGTRRSQLAELATTPPQIVEDVASAVRRGLDDLIGSVTGSLVGSPGGTGGEPARPGTAPGDGGPPPGDGTTRDGEGGRGSAAGPPPAPRAQPLVRAGFGVAAASQPAGATASAGDGSCAGAQALSTQTGCEPPAVPAGRTGATAESESSLAGAPDDQSVAVMI